MNKKLIKQAEKLISQAQLVRYKWLLPYKHDLWSCSSIMDETDVDYELNILRGRNRYDYDLDAGVYYYKSLPNGELKLIGIINKDGIKYL